MGPTSTERHQLHEGDNLDVLPRLAASGWAGAVDAIVIDPPYYTGRRPTWKHGLAYRDIQDDWVTFMSDRLEAMRPLMAPHASVAVSIGPERVHELGMVLRQVFPGYEHVTVTVDVGGTTIAKGVQRRAEYLLLAVPPAVTLDGGSGFTEGHERAAFDALTLSTFTERDYPNQVFAVHVDVATQRIVGAGPSIKQLIDAGTWDGDWAAATGDVPEGCAAIWPVTSRGASKRVVWRLSRDTFLERLAAGHIRAVPCRSTKHDQPFTIQGLLAGVVKRIESGEVEVLGRDANGVLEVGRIMPAGSAIPTIWAKPEYQTHYGTRRLDDLVPGHGFPYPKPVALIADIVRAVTSGRRDAVVLDAFAGSGTLVDALAQLNAGDGGARRAVLITLDENGIADRVTVPRMQAIGALHPAETFSVARATADLAVA